MFRSEDGGASWEPIAGFNDHPQYSMGVTGTGGTPDGPVLHSILVDPRDARHLYISVSGALGGTFESHDRGANWKPMFGEMEKSRRKMNKAGHNILMKIPVPYDAITWENGDIIVTIEAFLLSPGYLAAVISHETIHFDQFTTPNLGNKMTSVARERAAYNMMRGLTNRGIFQLSPAELAKIEVNFKHAMKNASSSPNALMAGGSAFYSVDLTVNPNGEVLP